MLASLSIATTLSSVPSAAPFTPPDATLNTIAIGSSDFTQQTLPLAMCKDWPLWMGAPDGSSVTRLPDESDDEGWVNPAAFEQLWQPLDLPSPDAHAAIGCVLKNGVPRYLFPCLETRTITAGGALDGMVWHNRGLNSCPLAKTWLPFGNIPTDQLRLSCYRQPLPPPPPPEVNGEGGDDSLREGASAEGTTTTPEFDAAVEAVAPLADWQPVLPLTEVSSAVATLMEIVSSAPDALGEGFVYLIVPLREVATGRPVALPQEAVEPGQRLRLFLSDVDATPTSLDPQDRESWLWYRGEMDLGIYNVAPGRDSEFLPEVYKALYER